MSKTERDRRAGALLKSRAATLRQLAREAKRLGRPNAMANTREADMSPEATAAQKELRAGIQQWEGSPIG